jgi:hypothetical protein
MLPTTERSENVNKIYNFITPPLATTLKLPTMPKLLTTPTLPTMPTTTITTQNFVLSAHNCCQSTAPSQLSTTSTTATENLN